MPSPAERHGSSQEPLRLTRRTLLQAGVVFGSTALGTSLLSGVPKVRAAEPAPNAPTKPIIDAHVHLYNHDGMNADQLMEISTQCGIGETWLSCAFLPGESGDIGDQHVEEAVRKYPGRIRGMGGIILGRDTGEKVKRLKDRGFFGLKVIFPMRPYDDPANDDVWREAQRLRMPITFHTGATVGSPDTIRRFGITYNMNPNWMTPERLDRVAMYFPELVMLLAHMGNTRIQDACAVARHPNVYLDASGGGLLKTMPKAFFDQVIYWELAKHKLVFGSDNYFKAIPGDIERTRKFAETKQLSDADTQLMWRGNAEKIIQYTQR